MATNTVEIQLLLDNSSVQKGLKKTDQSIDKLGKNGEKSFSKIGNAINAIPLISLALGVTKFLKESVNAASDLEEEIQKFGVIFRDVKDEAEGFAQILQNEFGQSEVSAKRLLSSTGDLLTGLGFLQEDALKTSNEIAKLGIDLASFSNFAGGAEGATNILTKALLGETESLVSLGIKINQNDKAYKASIKTIQETTGATLQQAKAQAIYGAIVDQTKNAQGDFARSSKQFANTLRTLGNRGQDLLATVGKELLPSLASLGQALISVSKTGSPFIKFFKLSLIPLKTVIFTITELINLLEFTKNKISEAYDTKQSEQSLLKLQRIQKNLGQDVEELDRIKREGKGDSEQAKILEANIKRNQRLTQDAARLADQQSKSAESYASNATDAYKRVEDAYNDAWGASSQPETEAAERSVENIKKITEETGKKNTKLTDEQKKLNEKLAEREEKQYLDSLDRLDIFFEEAGEKWGEYYENLTNLTLQFTGALSEIYQMDADNQTTRIEQRLEKEKEALDQQEQDRLEAAGVAEKTEKQTAQSELKILQEKLIAETTAEGKADLAQQIKEKEDEIKRLEIKEEFDAKRAAAEKKAEDEKRRVQRENAKVQKKINTIETVIATANAMMQAYKALAGIPYIGPALGAAAATAAGAFGAKQIQLIQSQPLPLATGGIVPGSGDGDTVPAVLTPGETVVPKDFTEEVLDRQAGATGMTNIYFQLGNDTFYASIQNGINDGDIIIREEDISTI